MTQKHMRWGWFFVTPYVIGFLIFTLFPVLFSMYISFTDYNLFNPPTWVGMKNFINVIKSPDIWIGLRNIFTYAIIMQFLQIAVGCIFAALLNQKIKGLSMFRILFFLPALTPMAAVCFVWIAMYNPSYGVLNYLLSLINLGPFNYTFSSNWFEAVASIAVMQAWKGVGYTTLYLLAGLQGISEDVMEAATVDGAGPVRKFFKITIPLLSPTIFFLLMVGIIQSMQIFDPFFLMQQGTGADTTVIGTLIYNNAFVYSKVGLAAAIGWVSFVVIALLTLVQKKMEKRWVFYG